MLLLELEQYMVRTTIFCSSSICFMLVSSGTEIEQAAHETKHICVPTLWAAHLIIACCCRVHFRSTNRQTPACMPPQVAIKTMPE